MAIDSSKATLAVKRRLACEMVKYWQQVNTLIRFDRLKLASTTWKHLKFSSMLQFSCRWPLKQAQDNLMNLPLANGWGEKHRLFVKWKYVEAKVLSYSLHSVNLSGPFQLIY